jgi:arsenate reductase
MPLTIYEKPTCSTCREVMTILKEEGVDFDAINYIIDPPSKAKLKELIGLLGITPRELVRAREPEYKELGLDDPGVSDAAIIDAMASHPALIQRPILVDGRRAIIGRPAERVRDFLRKK